MHRRTFAKALCAGALTRQAPSGGEPPLYLLTYDHGGLVLWGLDHMAIQLRDAAAWLARYPGFKIGLDNEAHTYDHLASHAPQLLDEIRLYLKRYKGRFGIGTCTYGQPLSCFISEEANIRQIEYSLETTRRYFGTAPDIYLMSEHAMHSQLPQILNSFGFRAAIMRTHYMMYGYNPTFNLPFGWWVGLDASRIPAVPTYPGQGNSFGKTTVDNWILTRCPGPQCRGSLDEFRAQFSHIRPLIATRADDAALRREDLVRSTESRKDCRWLLLEDLPGILPSPAGDMRTAPNDFVVRMPWGYCGNEIWNQSRRAEVSVLSAERAAAIGFLLGGEDHEPELRQSWKNLLVAQHHDIQICGLLPDARRYLDTSLAASSRVVQASLRGVAARMAGGPGGQVTVFNPSSRSRREWVEVTVTLPSRFGKGVQLRHGTQTVPFFLTSALRSSSDSLQEARIALLADVPPLAFTSYSVRPSDEAAPVEAPARISSTSDPLRVETPFWRIELSPNGGIAALTCRKTGATLLEAGKRSAYFAGRVDGKACESEGRWRILPGPDGACWIDAREDGAIGGILYRSELRMWADSPRLDYRVRFEFDDQRIGQVSENRRDSTSPFVHEEKLRFKLHPATGPDTTGVRDAPFAISETSDRYVQGNYWAAICGREAGLAFFNRGTMGTVREPDGGFSLPLAYSMYYVWGTRMLRGEFMYEFALWPFRGPWAENDLHRHALDYNFPMAVLATQPGNGRLGHVAKPLDLQGGDVLITALYTRNRRLYARLFEYRGREANAAIQCPAAGRPEEVSLAGSSIGPFTPGFAPWQVRTFRFGKGAAKGTHSRHTRQK